MLAVPRSARFVSWGNAALGGRVSPDTAADRIRAEDGPHRLLGLPGEEGAVSLPLALARLRSGGSSGLRLVLPVAGDPAGLPGPTGFNLDALERGEAVLAAGHGAVPGLGLVPELSSVDGEAQVLWRVHEVRCGAPVGQPTLAEADRMLREALLECTRELTELDVARWRPELADALKDLREDRQLQDALAPGYPARAVSVLSLARKVAGIAALAGGDAGAAVSAGQIDRRSALLQHLAQAGRRAQVAAYNAVVEAG